MQKRTLVVLGTVVALVTSCGGGGSTGTSGSSGTSGSTATTEAPATTEVSSRSVTINPLAYDGGTKKGTVIPTTLTWTKSTDGKLRVDVSEDVAGGAGEQLRASVWNAAVVGTLLTGKPLRGEFKLATTGLVDGPSAGMLETVAVIALLRGDTLDAKVTMTGTINPDGTVGPVGGIPEKIAGLADKGITTVLIPVGQRNTTSEATGEMVDVVSLGSENGVTVKEVSNVYDAYKVFTGSELPRLRSSATLALDDTTYKRLKASADAALGDFDEMITKIKALDPAIIDMLQGLINDSIQLADRARNLQQQGLQAGAFDAAWQASAEAHAADAVGENLQTLATQGVDAYFTRVASSQAASSATQALFDTLQTYQPTTLSSASALMASYGAALDALTVAKYGQSQIDTLVQAYRNGELSEGDLTAQLVLPTFLLEFAGMGVDYAKAIFDVSRDLPGAPIDPGVNVGAVADFFSQAAASNFQAFRTIVVKELSTQYGVSEDKVLNRLADLDINVLLSLSAQQTVNDESNYIGAGKGNADYATLGYAITNYARNAGLLDKYYANGVLDSNLDVTDVRSTAALTSSLELGKSQLEGAIGVLRAAGTPAAGETAGLEVASVYREGSVSDKFTALEDYWAGFVSARVLAYLGGLEANGLS